MLTDDTPNVAATNHVAQVKRQPRILWLMCEVTINQLLNWKYNLYVHALFANPCRDLNLGPRVRSTCTSDALDGSATEAG